MAPGIVAPDPKRETWFGVVGHFDRDFVRGRGHHDRPEGTGWAGAGGSDDGRGSSGGTSSGTTGRGSSIGSCSSPMFMGTPFCSDNNALVSDSHDAALRPRSTARVLYRAHLNEVIVLQIGDDGVDHGGGGVSGKHILGDLGP